MFETVEVLMNVWLIVLLAFGLWFVADDFDRTSSGNWWALVLTLPPVLWALWLAGRDIWLVIVPLRGVMAGL